MNRQEYEETRKAQQEILHFLEHENPSPEERDRLEAMLPALAGSLLSVWVPFDWPRRIIIAALFGGGLYGLGTGNDSLLAMWLCVPLFSPRVMGETTFFLGRIAGDFMRGFRENRRHADSPHDTHGE